MNKNENLKQLKMALMNHKNFKVYLSGEYYDTFMFNGKNNLYQGQFGCLTLDSMVDAINGLLPHIKLELSNE